MGANGESRPGGGGGEAVRLVGWQRRRRRRLTLWPRVRGRREPPAGPVGDPGRSSIGTIDDDPRQTVSEKWALGERGRFRGDALQPRAGAAEVRAPGHG